MLTRVSYSMIGGANANVLDYGAIANDTTDCSAFFQAAIDAVNSAGGGTVFIPSGTYFLNSTITLKQGVVLQGAGRSGTVLRGAGANFTAITSAVVGSGAGVIGIYMNANNTAITGITVRAFGCGIFMNSPFWSKVYLARMKDCRIGLRCNECYITSIFENNIDYNKFNVVMEGQSYQLTLYANDIDNQIQFTAGGNTARAPGVFIKGDNGSVIRDNVIEAAGGTIGSGIVMVGVSQRSVIVGNWFEQNGDGIYSADIMLGLPNNALGNAIAASLPEEYAISTPQFVTSNIDIHDNFHYATKYGIVGTFFFDTLNVTIANEVFVGIKGRNNQPITLFTDNSTSSTTFRIRDCTVFNSADNTIDAEMLSGIKNSYVFIGAGFNNYTYNAIILDGVDLFTKQMTMYEFSQLPGATLSCNYAAPTSGTATSSNDVRCAIGTIGVRTVEGTGRARVQTPAGSTVVVPTGNPIYGIALKVFNNVVEGISYQYDVGLTSFISRTDGRFFNVQLMITPTNSTATYYTGDYFGYCFMSVADYNTHFAGARRLQLVDLTLYGNP